MGSIVFLVIVAAVAFWAIGLYNGLVTARNAYKNAFAQIAVQLTRRYDLIPNLDSVAESAPAVSRFQMVADPRLQPLAPTAPERHPRIDDWYDLRAAIEAAVLT